jgi:hypothetical protein
MTGTSWCRSLGSVFVVFAVCLVLVGCGGSKVTSDNFMKIKPGMTEKEVTDILGSATENKDIDEAGAKKESIWKSGNSSINIKYDKDKKVVGMKGDFK